MRLINSDSELKEPVDAGQTKIPTPESSLSTTKNSPKPSPRKNRESMDINDGETAVKEDQLPAVDTSKQKNFL